jgi:hypothetical protein
VTILDTNPSSHTDIYIILLATTLAADFADAETVDGVSVDLVTTMKT